MQNSLILNSSIFSKRLLKILDLKINLKFLWIISAILIISLLVFYIFQINALTAEIYFVKSSQEKLSLLSSENDTLSINFAKVNSLNHIENYLSEQNFEKVTQVKYIPILSASVAAKSELLKE